MAIDEVYLEVVRHLGSYLLLYLLRCLVLQSLYKARSSVGRYLKGGRKMEVIYSRRGILFAIDGNLIWSWCNSNGLQSLVNCGFIRKS